MKQILATLALFALAACGGDATKIRPASFAEMKGWQEDRLSTPFKLFTDSCARNATRASAYQSKEEGPIGVRQHWSYACEQAALLGEPDEPTARRFFETYFQPYKVETESQSKGLVTGYYEPIINGSTTRKAPYLTPVYGVPSDLGTKKPYHSRAEIVNGALKGKAPVLYWVDDPVLFFFLQVQGSGKVRLPDGSLSGIQYAGQNGYAYTPIGRVLKDRGELTAVSMQSIRDWLRAHPRQMDEVMNQNKSFVFFKKGPGDKAAKGALGIPLTPMRSIAIDDDRAAYGVPTYLDTTISEYKSGRQIPFRRLMVSQDTGGALHSPHRADLFFGQGTVEEWQAGHQNARADTFWLLPVGVPPTLPVAPLMVAPTPLPADLPEGTLVVPATPVPAAPAPIEALVVDAPVLPPADVPAPTAVPLPPATAPAPVTVP